MELNQAKARIAEHLANQSVKLPLDYAVPFRDMWVFFFKRSPRQRVSPLAVQADGSVKMFNPITFDYTDQEFAKAHRKLVKL
jgi:hypothetical protein